MFYFKDDKQITVYFSDGNIASWTNKDPEFEEVIKLAKSSNWQPIKFMSNTAKGIITAKAIIFDDDDSVTVDGIKLDNKTSEKLDLIKLIKILKQEGLVDKDIEAIRPFLMNIIDNPYINAAKEVYDYLTKLDFLITDDGCILAYKHVNKNLTSCYDNKTEHAIGKYTTVDIFDTDRSRTCSNGLHFCSKNYLNYYSGDITICVKVNPKDIVSIPTDYNFEKGRCCRYMTLGILPEGISLKDFDVEKEFGVKVVNLCKEEEENYAETLFAVDEEEYKTDLEEFVNKLFYDGEIGVTFNHVILNHIYGMSEQDNANTEHVTEETVKRYVRKFKEFMKKYDV